MHPLIARFASKYVRPISLGGSVIALVGLMVSGCASEKDLDYTPVRGFTASDQGLVARKITVAVARLMATAEKNATARGEDLGKIVTRQDGSFYVPENRTVVVTTPVSINRSDVGTQEAPVSSQFGRNAREIIAASIGPRFRVIEPRATAEVTMKVNQGEFTLNRDLTQRSAKSPTLEVPADLIVSGTYTEGSGNTQLNLSVLRGEEVLAATTIILPYRSDLM